MTLRREVTSPHSHGCQVVGGERQSILQSHPPLHSPTSIIHSFLTLLVSIVSSSLKCKTPSTLKIPFNVIRVSSQQLAHPGTGMFNTLPSSLGPSTNVDCKDWACRVTPGASPLLFVRAMLTFHLYLNLNCTYDTKLPIKGVLV